MFWWVIKIFRIQRIWNHSYCKENYPSNSLQDACNANDLCIFRANGDIEASCQRPWDYFLGGLYWILLFVLWLILEICRLFLGMAQLSADGFASGINIDCWYPCSQCGNNCFNDKFEAKKHYDRREYWSCKDPCESNLMDDNIDGCNCFGWRCCGNHAGFVTQCFDVAWKYIHILIFGSIYYAKFSKKDIGDFAVTDYEYWVVIALLVIKYALQIWYKCGKPYDEDEEEMKRERFEKAEYMIFVYGEVVANIIGEFTGDFEANDYYGVLNDGVTNCYGFRRSGFEEREKGDHEMKELSQNLIDDERVI